MTSQTIITSYGRQYELSADIAANRERYRDVYADAVLEGRVHGDVYWDTTGAEYGGTPEKPVFCALGAAGVMIPELIEKDTNTLNERDVYEVLSAYLFVSGRALAELEDCVLGGSQQDAEDGLKLIDQIFHEFPLTHAD